MYVIIHWILPLICTYVIKAPTIRALCCVGISLALTFFNHKTLTWGEMMTRNEEHWKFISWHRENFTKIFVLKKNQWHGELIDIQYQLQLLTNIWTLFKLFSMTLAEFPIYDLRVMHACKWRRADTFPDKTSPWQTSLLKTRKPGVSIFHQEYTQHYFFICKYCTISLGRPRHSNPTVTSPFSFITFLTSHLHRCIRDLGVLPSRLDGSDAE